ncbi:MAG: RsmE family RNA methyltransferase [Patescibacteria group bacterium]|nr:RsmE family RNA methyltransferase [Patescibacteria group bacterium]
MPYFLSPVNLQIGQTLDLTGEEAGHLLLSRRLRPGEAVRLQGPDGKRFLCEAVEVRKKNLTAVVKEPATVPPEPKTVTTLFLAYINQAALDVVLQKTTELLAGRIVLFNSQNVAHVLTRQKFEERHLRWGKILWEGGKTKRKGCAARIGVCKRFISCNYAGGKIRSGNFA